MYFCRLPDYRLLLFQKTRLFIRPASLGMVWGRCGFAHQLLYLLIVYRQKEFDNRLVLAGKKWCGIH